MQNNARYRIVAMAVGLLLAAASLLSAKDFPGGIRLDRTVHDFGKITLKDGPCSCEFTVENCGETPFNIQAVISSCGCTTPEWTRTDIPAGGKGTIRATYSNDEGAFPFDKTLTVYISGSPKPIVLHLRGEVVEK
ncbi:MAG: DUF1573 domain-containing protein [Bacteroidales bacterium]|nr:DUF1573 domain-containing protein [Bacteroidales bacterium]